MNFFLEKTDFQQPCYIQTSRFIRHTDLYKKIEGIQANYNPSIGIEKNIELDLKPNVLQ